MNLEDILQLAERRQKIIGSKKIVGGRTGGYKYFFKNGATLKVTKSTIFRNDTWNKVNRVELDRVELTKANGEVEIWRHGLRDIVIEIIYNNVK